MSVNWTKGVMRQNGAGTSEFEWPLIAKILAGAVTILLAASVVALVTNYQQSVLNGERITVLAAEVRRLSEVLSGGIEERLRALERAEDRRDGADGHKGGSWKRP